MKKLSHVLEYVLLRSLEFCIGVVPRKLALIAGENFGLTLYYLGIYRKIVKRNLDHVGLYPPDRQKEITRQLYTNVGKYAVDMLRPVDKVPSYTVENLDAVHQALKNGKGLIAVLAHFGNWELMATFFGTVFSDLNVLARPMHNPLVEKWLLAKRKQSKVTPIYASGALRKIIVVLKRNGLIAMLIDQFSAEQGIPAPFLGKTANTVRTVAGLLQKLDFGIVLPYAIMQKDGSYRVVIEEAAPILISRDNEDEFIAAVLQAHNDVISQWITKYPQHYFGWFHRRFKDVISYK